MPPEFLEVDREKPQFLPRSIEDYVGEHHPARIVVEIVERLDLRCLMAAHATDGERPFHPERLVALLFYGYATGVFSSRSLERATHESLPFLYITGGDHPDHNTIAAFRDRFQLVLRGLFLQILTVAQTLGILKGMSGIDVTKIQADPSDDTAVSRDHADRLEARLKAEIDIWMAKAEKAETEPEPQLYCPPELADPETMRETIKRALDVINSRPTNEAKTGRRPKARRHKRGRGRRRRTR